MDSKTVMFSILVITAIFAMAVPIDDAFAQNYEITVDGEDGDHEGKSCPFKNKTASIIPGLSI